MCRLSSEILASLKWTPFSEAARREENQNRRLWQVVVGGWCTSRRVRSEIDWISAIITFFLAVVNGGQSAREWNQSSWRDLSQILSLAVSNFNFSNFAASQRAYYENDFSCPHYPAFQINLFCGGGFPCTSFFPIIFEFQKHWNVLTINQCTTARLQLPFSWNCDGLCTNTAVIAEKVVTRAHKLQLHFFPFFSLCSDLNPSSASLGCFIPFFIFLLF